MTVEPLESEQVILSSPMSWTGSTIRLWRWLHPRAVTSAGWAKAGWWTLLWTVLILAWIVVLAWYALLAFFGLIPLIILIVYRVTRRGQRKRHQGALRHAELMSHRREAAR